MKHLIFYALLISLVGAKSASAATANSIGLLIDLESKISQEIKAEIQSVDPDAIVTTNISIKELSADLVGTQMQAVGLFATGEGQKIEDEDIQSVNVVLMSGLDPFPAALAKIVELTVTGVSKKGKLQILKMDPAILSAIMKNKEYQKANQDYQKASTDQLEKFRGMAEAVVRDIPAGVLKLVGVLTGILFVLLILGGAILMRLFGSLGNKIASLKIEGGAGQASAAPQISAPEQAPRENAGSGSSGASGTMTSQDSPFKNMPIESLRAIFADAYWCSQDAFAAWVWRQLNAEAKLKLLEAWPNISAYSRYLNQVEPVMAQYHLDSSYLKPESYHHLSNEDLLKLIRERKNLWHCLSSMRRLSFTVDLKERLALMSAAPLSDAAVWPTQASVARQLVTKIEIARLSSADEELLFTDPGLLTPEQQKQFPSLVWVALLEVPLRTKVLEEIPALALAEIWKGPTQALDKIREVLPEKKRNLLDDYVKKIRPKSESPWLTSLSKTAQEALTFRAPERDGKEALDQQTQPVAKAS